MPLALEIRAWLCLRGADKMGTQKYKNKKKKKNITITFFSDKSRQILLLISLLAWSQVSNIGAPINYY